MYILAGDKNVVITNYIVNRHDNKRGLVLTINTTTDNISLADMDTLCTEIKANSLDILVYGDNDELEQTLRGFYHNCICSKDTEGNIIAEITNESENTYQIGLMKDKANAQDQAINAQNVQVAELEEMSASQIDAIDSILLEVLPTMISDAVKQAVTEAVAVISEPVDDEEIVESVTE